MMMVFEAMMAVIVEVVVEKAVALMVGSGSDDGGSGEAKSWYLTQNLPFPKT